MKIRNFVWLLTVVAAAGLAANANAATCTLRSSSGSCLLYTSVEALIFITDNPAFYLGGGGMTQFVTSIVPTGDGLVTCGAPGSNKPSPGIQMVYLTDFSAFFTPIVDIRNIITKNDIKSGQATIDIGGRFYERVTGTNPCPNANWIPLDAIACDTNLVVRLQSVSDSTTIEAVQESCTLDDTNTVTVNECLSTPVNLKTGIFQKTFYACGTATPIP